MSAVFPQYGLCWVSVAVFRTTVNNADGIRYRNCCSISWIVNTYSFTLRKRCGWVRRISETMRGSYVYNNSSSAAIHMQQHFPLVYLSIYNIVSLLWANHSCSAIYLLTSFFIILFSIVILLAGLLTHSLSPCLVFNKVHVIFCLSQKGLSLPTSCFFCHADWGLAVPLSTGGRPPSYMHSDVNADSPSFRERLILLFPTRCPCFPAPLFTFRALCCHPFHQRLCLGIRGATLLYCINTRLQTTDIHPFTWMESVASRPRPIVVTEIVFI